MKNKPTMHRNLFAITFLLGAMVVVWVGAGFASTHLLALMMTLIIAAVYGYGAWELHHFRQATLTLSTALAAIPDKLTNLNDWLGSVHGSLQNPVRLRIEGERMGLPGPALTPYLVGLLVMLGMLGTFLGMVVTLNGAVFALEGTTDLQAIRSALSAPIKGLGLSFGTSVAGVATSAMLGLMSALSRRERLAAAQLLDSKIATVLRGFSLTHQRQETYKALQSQANALPEVVTQLQTMMDQMERMNQRLNERLASSQESFHSEVKAVYTELATSVDQSLKNSLTHSAQVASESITPVIQAAMSGMAQEARLLHERVVDTAQTQLSGLSERFSATTSSLADTWQAALSKHEQSSAQLITGVGQSLNTFTEVFEQRSAALVTSVDQAHTRLLAEQAAAEQQRLAAWTGSLESMATTLQQEWQQSGAQMLAQQQHICATLSTTAQDLREQAQASTEAWKAALSTHEQTSAQLITGVGQSLNTFTEVFEQRSAALVTTVDQAHSRLLAEQASAEQQRLAAWTDSLESMATTLQQEWQQSGAQTLAQQQQVCSTLSQTAQDITEQARMNASHTLGEISRLVTCSEDLMQARMAAEAQGMQQHGERMDQLTSVLQTELSALRDDEAQRGQAAVERLGDLQAALSVHLTTLGTALEAPITRLIETASQAPKAAAELITQLRQELSSSMARDNELLEERSRIMATLSALLDGINHAAAEQRAVIDTLVNTSAESLKQAGSQFAVQVDTEAAKLTDIAAQVTSSAVEVSSLSESFSFAVNAFSEANEKLIANLQRIEGAMDKSMARSDEQLAYYVAQAREIIDLSVMSQKEIFDELRQLPAKQAQLAQEVI
jgi:hypothetical protein